MTTTLHPELQRCLYEEDMLGQCLKHPLVFGVPYFPQLADRYNQQLTHKREQVIMAMEDRDWDQYVWLHERAYRWDALNDLFPEIPDNEFWPLFGAVYTDSENINQHYDQISGWLDLPAIPSCIMTEDEQQHLATLPEIVTVYRGFDESENINSPSDWSWTTDLQIAQWFAGRFDRHGPVITGTVHRKNIMAFFDRRGESETLVWGYDVEGTHLV